MSCRAVAPCVSCRVSRALTSHTRHAQVATDEQDLEDELDQVSSGTGKKKATTAAKGKGKAAAATTKKKSRIPALELEKVPDRPKMSKTARITADAEEEEGEEEEGEEEEEEDLRRGGKRGRTSAAGKKKKNQATTKKSKRGVVEEQEEKDDEGEGLSGEELVEEMEE